MLTQEWVKPHICLIDTFCRPNRDTTKFRVVFDASAKVNGEGPSLNVCLDPGPLLLPLVFNIFLRFRLYKVVLIWDSEKAFLNIAMVPEH